VLRAARARPYAMTEDEMRAEICVGLGGHAAERMALAEVSIGAYTDLQQANAIARAMVQEYGMSRLGPRVVISERDAAPASEVRRARIDEEIDRILDEEKARADRLLREHRPLHDTLVKLLLEVKVLDAKAIGDIVKAKVA
jgi:cell division protease FtsH